MDCVLLPKFEGYTPHLVCPDVVYNLLFVVVVYNLLVEYFDGRCHVTRVGSPISSRVMINCSIVQGSCFGPVNYILNLCDMRPCVVLNDYSKYADDGDLVVPSVNTDTIQIQVDNITKWTELNNLKLMGVKLRN